MACRAVLCFFGSDSDRETSIDSIDFDPEVDIVLLQTVNLDWSRKQVGFLWIVIFAAVSEIVVGVGMRRVADGR